MAGKRLRRVIWIYLGGLLGIIALFVALAVYCNCESRKLRTYEFQMGKLGVPQDGLVLSISVSKQWNDNGVHPDASIGAQYDGVLTNDSKHTFQNWNAELTLSQEAIIDSSWNGEYDQTDNVIHFTAKDHTAIVKPHNTATFGAVMNAKKVVTLQNYVLKGYQIYRLQDMFLFRALVIAFGIWIIMMFMHVVISLKTEKYKVRQELDRKIINQSISTFTGFIDAKDSYTKGHSARVAEYASEIYKRMKMGKEQIRQIYQIGLMHDCGKIGIPDAVLKKPGPLTKEEYEIVKSHTTLGYELLDNFTSIPGMRDGVRYHHERYDGKGYPTGLTGEDIPLVARVICIADSFDAMSSNRCYRKHLSNETIVNELNENAGKQFDPELVHYMIEMMEDGFVEKIRISEGVGA